MFWLEIYLLICSIIALYILKVYCKIEYNMKIGEKIFIVIVSFVPLINLVGLIATFQDVLDHKNKENEKYQKHKQKFKTNIYYCGTNKLLEEIKRYSEYEDELNKISTCEKLADDLLDFIKKSSYNNEVQEILKSEVKRKSSLTEEVLKLSLENFKENKTKSDIIIANKTLSEVKYSNDDIEAKIELAKQYKNCDKEDE